MILVFIVLALVFGWGSLAWGKSTFKNAKQAIGIADDSTIPGLLDRCRESTGPDHDKDGLPDFCDNCPLISNYGADADGDLFPKGCCGNENKGYYLKDVSKGAVEENYQDARWCAKDPKKDTSEKDTFDESPRHPKYSPPWQ